MDISSPSSQRPTPVSGTLPAQAPGTPSAALSATGASATEPLPSDPVQSAAAERLHYLFRRSTTEHTHVLKKALFDYRGVALP